MTEALPTDLITGQPVEPWAMHFLDKREDVRECVARAISIPQHHTTWDLLSEPEKNLFYMQADYAISAILAAQGTEAQRARQRMRPNPIRRGK